MYMLHVLFTHTTQNSDLFTEKYVKYLYAITYYNTHKYNIAILQLISYYYYRTILYTYYIHS